MERLLAGRPLFYMFPDAVYSNSYGVLRLSPQKANAPYARVSGTHEYLVYS